MSHSGNNVQVSQKDITNNALALFGHIHCASNQGRVHQQNVPKYFATENENEHVLLVLLDKFR
jgi:hypothetical protein